MKMLKKLAALILAATMVLVLFTACGGDSGSTGTREPEKEKAAFESIAGTDRFLWCKVLWQSSRGWQGGRVSDHYRDDKIRLRVFFEDIPEDT